MPFIPARYSLRNRKPVTPTPRHPVWPPPSAVNFWSLCYATSRQVGRPRHPRRNTLRSALPAHRTLRWSSHLTFLLPSLRSRQCWSGPAASPWSCPRHRLWSPPGSAHQAPGFREHLRAGENPSPSFSVSFRFEYPATYCIIPLVCLESITC